MKLLLASAALLVGTLFFAGTLYAQAPWAGGGRGSFPGCPTCGVWSAVDAPAASSPSPTVAFGHLYIAGWGFECVSGAPVDRVDVLYRNDEGTLVTAKTKLYPGLARPDVQAAFSGQCSPAWDSGFHVYFLTPIPRGQREVYINTWRGAYFETHRRDLFIR